MQSKLRSAKGFCSQLAHTYKMLQESGQKFEIIFVNCDDDVEAWQEYVETMPWIALPFKDERIRSLAAVFNIECK